MVATKLKLLPINLCITRRKYPSNSFFAPVSVRLVIAFPGWVYIFTESVPCKPAWFRAEWKSSCLSWLPHYFLLWLFPLCTTDFFLHCPLFRYTLEQQIIAPQFSMHQVNCNAVLVPSPVFTSPIMIPHNSFMSNQSQSAYHSQPQASQHSLQLQQPQQFFQVRLPPVWPPCDHVTWHLNACFWLSCASVSWTIVFIVITQGCVFTDLWSFQALLCFRILSHHGNRLLCNSQRPLGKRLCYFQSRALQWSCNVVTRFIRADIESFVSSSFLWFQ